MVLLCYQLTPGLDGYAHHLSMDSLLGEDILDRKQDGKLLHNLLASFFQSSRLPTTDAFFQSQQIVEHINNLILFNNRPLIKLRVAVTVGGQVELQSLESEKSFNVFGEVSVN